MQYQKVKSVAKTVIGRGDQLQNLILDTMKRCADIVGSTLGPGGMSVVIERQEDGLPPIVTKDGVTVFRSLGFADPAAHVLMEAARDASVRTATEAGDGPQPLWSRVLTPKGFVRMGDVVVGMEVCGSNGSTQKVLGVYPKGKKRLVKVIFEGGHVVECCEDHLWTVVDLKGLKETITTATMLKGLQSGDSYEYHTPRPEPVDFSVPAPKDPYLVGMILGRGYQGTDGEIHLRCSAKNEGRIGNLRLPKGIQAVARWNNEDATLSVAFDGATASGDTMLHHIRGLGIFNLEHDGRYIPEEYLYAPLESRRQLLQGIVDSDYSDAPEGLFSFSTHSRMFAYHLRELCASLGIRVGIEVVEGAPGPYWNAYNVKQMKSRPYGDRITNIELTNDFVEMQCIKVSNEDHLYVTDGFVLTHNTTTATILSEALVRETMQFCKNNPKISPQRLVRSLESYFRANIESRIRELSRKLDLGTKEDRLMLHAVAKVSANGDTELADAVMRCFDLVGSMGSVTIVEASGPSSYEVERIEGYTVGIGYEDCAGKFYQGFVNNAAKQTCSFESPSYVLYHGQINEIWTVLTLMDKIAAAAAAKTISPNVVLVATGFSESVLAHLHTNFVEPSTINVYPLKAPLTQSKTGQYDFLGDLAAITGGVILDPLNAPLENATLKNLGKTEAFEAARFRSTIIGYQDEILILERADALKAQLASGALSQLDMSLIQERLGKITGGIARLKVLGSSSGETREKRDRAEDAVCAVRGALNHGALPGGGWTLIKLAQECMARSKEMPALEVLGKALMAPVHRLYDNAGYHADEIEDIIGKIAGSESPVVYDILEGKLVDPYSGGLLDSTPAVLEAVKNSLSVATNQGTCGGVCVFKRDLESERQESRDVREFVRNANVNPADERF